MPFGRRISCVCRESQNDWAHAGACLRYLRQMSQQSAERYVSTDFRYFEVIYLFVVWKGTTAHAKLKISHHWETTTTDVCPKPFRRCVIYTNCERFDSLHKSTNGAASFAPGIGVIYVR